MISKLTLLIFLFVSSFTSAALLPIDKQIKIPENALLTEISNSDSLIVVLERTGVLRIINYLTDVEVNHFQIITSDLPEPVTMKLSPDGKLLAIVNYRSPQVVIYDITTGNRLYFVRFDYASGSLPGVLFSPSGEYLAISDPFIVDGAFIQVYEAHSGKKMALLGYDKNSGEEGFRSFDFISRDGRVDFLTLSYNACQLSIWDINSGSESRLVGTCANSIRVVNNAGLYVIADHQSLSFYNIVTGKKISSIWNIYKPPESEVLSYGDIYAYTFFDDKIVYLGDGPDLNGIRLRAFDTKTEIQIFQYELSNDSNKFMRLISLNEKKYLVTSKPGFINLTDLSKL
jgi:WD40 repeat protein